MKNKLKLIICLLSIYMSLYACVNIQQYPSDWPPIQIAKDKCVNISGVYKNLDSNNTNSLSDLLIKKFNGQKYFKEITNVTIIQSNEYIEVIANKGDIPLDKKKLEFGKDITCKGTELFFSNSNIADENVIGYESNQYTFNLSEDGSLIVHTKSSGYGIVIVIPVIGSFETYLRFEKYIP
jgi:hypothetical protein